MTDPLVQMQPGQHWTHSLPLPDLRPNFFIWSQTVDDAFRIVVELTESARAELHARGIICTVAAPMLNAAGLRLAEGGARPPDWLPEAGNEEPLPEDLAWLASLDRAIQANLADRVTQIIQDRPEALHGGEAGTALHLAIGCDRPAIADLLLRHGADPHARDAVGDTPLHLGAPVRSARTGRVAPDARS